MQYCRKDYIHKDSVDIPDAEPFVVYNDRDGTWAFAMRINRHFTLTKFHPQDAHEETVKHAKKQIMFCKTYGWSYMGQKTMNPEVDELEHEFMCLYCGKTTYNTSKPCLCRNTKIEDLYRKTSNGGIILPY